MVTRSRLRSTPLVRSRSSRPSSSLRYTLRNSWPNKAGPHTVQNKDGMRTIFIKIDNLDLYQSCFYSLNTVLENIIGTPKMRNNF